MHELVTASELSFTNLYSPPRDFQIQSNKTSKHYRLRYGSEDRGEEQCADDEPSPAKQAAILQKKVAQKSKKRLDLMFSPW